MKSCNPVAHQIMWCHNPTEHNHFYHEPGCLSETPVLTYQQIGQHNPQQKSQNRTYQPTTQDSNFNKNLNFTKMIRYGKATHSVFKSAQKKLRSLTANISPSWQEVPRLS
jgi:hypothetical protein